MVRGSGPLVGVGEGSIAGPNMPQPRERKGNGKKVCSGAGYRTPWEWAAGVWKRGLSCRIDSKGQSECRSPGNWAGQAARPLGPGSLAFVDGWEHAHHMWPGCCHRMYGGMVTQRSSQTYVSILHTNLCKSCGIFFFENIPQHHQRGDRSETHLRVPRTPAPDPLQGPFCCGLLSQQPSPVGGGDAGEGVCTTPSAQRMAGPQAACCVRTA